MKKTDALKHIVKESGIIERRIKRLEDKLVKQNELLEGIENLTISLMNNEITTEQVEEYFKKDDTIEE